MWEFFSRPCCAISVDIISPEDNWKSVASWGLCCRATLLIHYDLYLHSVYKTTVLGVFAVTDFPEAIIARRFVSESSNAVTVISVDCRVDAVPSTGTDGGSCWRRRRPG